MARRKTRSIYDHWADLNKDQLSLFPIQPGVFPANRAEPESASRGDGSANAADTGVTPSGVENSPATRAAPLPSIFPDLS